MAPSLDIFICVTPPAHTAKAYIETSKVERSEIGSLIKLFKKIINIFIFMFLSVKLLSGQFCRFNNSPSIPPNLTPLKTALPQLIKKEKLQASMTQSHVFGKLI